MTETTAAALADIQDIHVLVVDDIAANRKLLQGFLRRFDWQVTEASSGEEALALCQSGIGFDLILMDILMTGMDGQEAVRRIKAINPKDFVPVIYVTALSSETAYVDALAAGGDDFISKPITFRVLEAKIQAQLRIKALYRKLKESNQQLHRFNQHLVREHDLISLILEDAYQRSFKGAGAIRQYISPASNFNGDLLLSDLGPGGRYYLLLADFTGHGLVAAVGAIPVKQVFFKMAQMGTPLVDMARELNHHLHHFLPSHIFCAAILIQIDIYANQLLIWNGGMPDALLMLKDETKPKALTARHMPLGVLTDEEFDSTLDSLPLPLDAKLYLYSDGLTDALLPETPQEAEQHLLGLLEASAAQRFDALIDILKHQKQKDDVALVEIDLLRVQDVLPSQPMDETGPAKGCILPFRLEFELGPQQMRELDPVTIIVNSLCQQPRTLAHKDLLHTLLSELYNNALEHSLLGLGSVNKGDTEAFMQYYQERQRRLDALEHGSIKIQLEVKTSESGTGLEILCQDNGQGFAKSDASDALLPQIQLGRGLSLIQGLCHEVSYSDRGRKVRACYRL